MTTNDASVLFDKVSSTVLTAIKTMSDRQQTKKPICMDSISLVLKISVRDLTPILEHLESQGHLIIHPNLSEKTRKTNKPDSVSLN